jgi:lysozyme
MMTIPIADVSHYQGYINWKEYASAREFAFIKCTEWIDYHDEYFDSNWLRAKDAGVMRAPYHFWRNVSIDGQLSNLMTNIGDDRGEGAVMVDMEIDQCDYDSLYEFCSQLETRFNRVVIYSSVRYWKDNNPRWLRFDLYVADWTPPVSIPKPWTTYKFHQQGVSGYGEVPGVSTRCDYGIFNGTHQDLLDYLGLAQLPPEEGDEDMTEINDKLDLILENQGIIIAMLDSGGGEEPRLSVDKTV